MVVVTELVELVEGSHLGYEYCHPTLVESGYSKKL